MNYFELFDIPVSLQPDKKSLPKKYFDLQKKYHPDFFSQSDEDEQSEALQKSSDINKGFKILQDLDLTIKYVLQLKGLLEEEEKYQLPPDFLMEMMELNEELSEDSEKAIRSRENDIYNEVKDIIENYNDATITTDKLLKVKEYYFKKKYLQRILDRMND
ncbi:Fe-S protein assembly co-chaperone HscB [Ferruginibacter lapsinanis]|uniref:Fe-S protein assembly co-chaperone HscB n=1 Tax=Ferruginibacter lapsinanis TaxID=563172 RepID=UPI001E433617|nr:Fe-S protein assembly co-chaperone HscB [Ferruginibacter lapsinanis]UEG49027.1 Fe-S protein assembly co-chaperone HscB [Ferruginibacter lapsinanis]